MSETGTVLPRARRTSAVLCALVEARSERISIAECMEALGDRVYGLLLVAFALPNLAPVVPPGLSAVLGLPILLISCQLAWGRPRPWLPQSISARSLPRAEVASISRRVLPYLERLERRLRPRWPWVVGWNGERVIGITCLVLCVILALPIPLGNVLPALAISILGLAMVEKDGVVAVVGYAAALVSLAVVTAVLVALFRAFLFFLSGALA